MFDTIGRSFNLFRACLRVLSMDKELLFFPLFAVIGLLAVMLAYLFVAISIGVFAGLESIGPIIGLSFLFYILAYFVGIFFNSALVFAAHERLTGGDPNIRSGLRGAARCIPSILIWAVIAATVGLILQILSIRSRRSGGVTGIIQRIIVALLGAAWNTLTYFIVPLIVIERSSFLDSFGSSVALVRRTWGEQVTASIGFGILQIFAYIAVAIVTVVLVLLLSPFGSDGITVAVFLGVAMFAFTTLIFATLKGIYKAALYNYATTGEVTNLFSLAVVRYAFIEE